MNFHQAGSRRWPGAADSGFSGTAPGEERQSAGNRRAVPHGKAQEKQSAKRRESASTAAESGRASGVAERRERRGGYLERRCRAGGAGFRRASTMRAACGGHIFVHITLKLKRWSCSIVERQVSAFALFNKVRAFARTLFFKC